MASGLAAVCGVAWALVVTPVAQANAAFEVRVVLSPRAVAACTATAPVAGNAVAVSCGPDRSAFSVPSVMSLPGAAMVVDARPGSTLAPGVVTASARSPINGRLSATATNTPLSSDSVVRTGVASADRFALPPAGRLSDRISLSLAGLEPGGPAGPESGEADRGASGSAASAIEMTLSF